MSVLNRAKVLRRVAHLRQLVGDPEAFHGAEDRLWREVLAAIRDGAEDPAGLAAAALRTADIEVPRWYS